MCDCTRILTCDVVNCVTEPAGWPVAQLKRCTVIHVSSKGLTVPARLIIIS